MNQQYKKGISIILPVYNNEKTLEKCISSILSQTYNNFELIIIDDGSSDLSSLICKKYVSIDQRISYTYKKNEGVCSARNLGLMKVTYDYIAFVDADDFIERDHLENFIKYIGKYDLVMQGMRYVNSNNKEINFLLNEKINTKISIVANNKQDINNIFLDIPAFGWVTNKLYKTKTIKMNNIRFSEVSIINGDRAFNLYYFMFIKSFIMLRTITYNYVENHSSISHKLIDPILFILAANEYSKVLKYNIYYKNLSNYIIKYSIKFYLRAIGECLISKKIKILRRAYIIIYAFFCIFKSGILKNNFIQTIKYAIEAIKYYKYKYCNQKYCKSIYK